MLITEAIDKENPDNHLTISYDKESNKYTVSVMNVRYDIFRSESFEAKVDPTKGEGLDVEDKEQALNLATEMSEDLQNIIENL